MRAITIFGERFLFYETFFPFVTVNCFADSCNEWRTDLTRVVDSLQAHEMYNVESG